MAVPDPGFLQLVTVAVFPVAMVAAGLSDMVSMTISNRLTGLLALAFPLAAIACGLPLGEFGWHAAVGAAALIIGIAFFAFGWIGGGDAKLFAATMLWFGPQEGLAYALVAAVFGGVLTLGLLAFRRMPLPSLLAARGWVFNLHDPQTGVPYGVALAAAGLVVFASSPWMTALNG